MCKGCYTAGRGPERTATRYVLTLDVPDRVGSIRVDPAQKLKQLLKVALRGFGIRAVSITESPAPRVVPTSTLHAGQYKGGDGLRVGSGADRAAASQPEALAGTVGVTQNIAGPFRGGGDMRVNVCQRSDNF